MQNITTQLYAAEAEREQRADVSIDGHIHDASRFVTKIGWRRPCAYNCSTTANPLLATTARKVISSF